MNFFITLYFLLPRQSDLRRHEIRSNYVRPNAFHRILVHTHFPLPHHQCQEYFELEWMREINLSYQQNSHWEFTAMGRKVKQNKRNSSSVGPNITQNCGWISRDSFYDSRSDLQEHVTYFTTEHSHSEYSYTNFELIANNISNWLEQRQWYRPGITKHMPAYVIY
jgi:hypothetical protein